MVQSMDTPPPSYCPPKVGSSRQHQAEAEIEMQNILLTHDEKLKALLKSALSVQSSLGSLKVDIEAKDTLDIDVTKYYYTCDSCHIRNKTIYLLLTTIALLGFFWVLTIILFCV
ncbi:hypothetical protein DFJ63DRAFT_315609 [Scheffersomyces coipomensis]|uniref:uncharacterized protein n=1 Tax=Scheffersomyces coipomensis TaxID=1788519 RepID=UPI00315C6059